MKLYYSNTSPYSRKVRLVIFEKCLDAQVEEVVVNPFEDNPELNAANPLGKIPVLLFDDDETLFDSPVICRYLDGLSNQHPLIPQEDKQQWLTMRWEALADGMTDAVYNLVMERRRPASEQSPTWIGRWAAEIQRVLQHMDQRVSELDGDISLAQLAVAASIGYLDLRIPELLYETQCPQVAEYPRLLEWYEKIATRPSMMATRPGDR
ncbi:MAG: glutathione S-transferase N-terminal domain-containing protein [Pseudomonadota bacterium]